MFVANLFENPVKNVIVVMPGGFHPFHQGHLALYNQARKAFPNAQVFVAATDYQEERPFPFAIKQRLAQEAGVPADRFIQVSSPFAPKEITEKFDSNTTALVFVRSDKDKNENPQPGKPGQVVTRGPRKGMAPYLQAYDGNPKPMSEHGYIAYLPTVEFKAGATGITSASEIRGIWPKANPRQKLQIVKDLYPNSKRPEVIVGLLDHAIIGETATESTEGQNPANHIHKSFKQHAIDRVTAALNNPKLSEKDIQQLQHQLHTLKQLRESIESLNETFFFQGYQIDIDPKTRVLTVSHKGRVLHTEKTSMVGRPGGAEAIKKRVSIIIDRLEDEKYPEDLEVRHDPKQDGINLDRVSEGAMKDLYTELADKYSELAPKIEKYKDSYLAGELYDALEEIAAKHGAIKEFRSMLNGARNRAHMDYDTNPGGFQNWFWYLPFSKDIAEDASGVIAKKDQEKDPRYMMSLTKDVRPGQIDKNLKAFKLK